MIKLNARQKQELRDLLSNPTEFLKKVQIITLPASGAEFEVRKAMEVIASKVIRDNLDDTYFNIFQNTEREKAIEKIDEQLAALKTRRTALLNGDD